MSDALIVKHLPLTDYATCLAAMQTFTRKRTTTTPDELWALQHPPVFTQGQAGKAEHLLNPGTVAVVQSDRGGQVTYHGPGQVVIYVMLNLKRLGLGIRSLVCALEQAIISWLATQGINAQGSREAPGVYVAGAKICSLGLRVRAGCSYHGLALNVDMDLSPFSRINPCGFEGLRVTQVRDCLKTKQKIDCETVSHECIRHIREHLGYTSNIN